MRFFLFILYLLLVNLSAIAQISEADIIGAWAYERSYADGTIKVFSPTDEQTEFITDLVIKTNGLVVVRGFPEEEECGSQIDKLNIPCIEGAWKWLNDQEIEIQYRFGGKDLILRGEIQNGKLETKLIPRFIRDEIIGFWNFKSFEENSTLSILAPSSRFKKNTKGYSFRDDGTFLVQLTAPDPFEDMTKRKKALLHETHEGQWIWTDQENITIYFETSKAQYFEIASLRGDRVVVTTLNIIRKGE